MTIEINFLDLESLDLVEQAFLNMYAVEKKADGTDLLTPNDNVKLHLQNFMRSVVSSYVDSKKAKSKPVCFEQDFRALVLKNREAIDKLNEEKNKPKD